jgi:hypothetical protein
MIRGLLVILKTNAIAQILFKALPLKYIKCNHINCVASNT